MTVKVLTVENNVECFETGKFVVSPVKDMNPLILSVWVYSGNKLICRRKRHFTWLYKHFTFKSKKVQDVLKQMEEVKQENKE